MPPADASRRSCAIYTRKSSEDGLEQEFNSLAAQREACEAYIRSQQHEGWVLVRSRYDDSAFSGGNLERPALQRLLADIRTGRIDIVVVYKVDRLTRSLADFTRLVEIFDAQDVSFVSVTQQFNTTSSMGRLTLNVLLSFAQFEREVTSERIRDKIAASKKKGMWMGGNVPLGYDAEERALVINLAEAESIRRIFGLYLQLGCVRRVKEEADRLGLRTKRRTAAKGAERGGTPFSRGHIYQLLSNPIYTGRIAHNGQHYPGQHPALIDDETWTAVRNQLAGNAADHRRRARAAEPSSTGRLDSRCSRRTSHAITRRQKRPTLSLLRLCCINHRASKGGDAKLAARRSQDRRLRDQYPGRRAEQPGELGQTARQSWYAQRPDSESARPCCPSCSKAPQPTRGTSQDRTRAGRAGDRRRQKDHDQDAACRAVGHTRLAMCV